MTEPSERSNTFEDPRAFLGRHGLRPRESFGQCFLVARPVAEAIVAALDPGPDETVVEIGTGTGTLARMLAPRCGRVLALERDRDLARALMAEGLPGNVTLVETDAVTYDYAGACGAGPWSVVGNLPYQLTGRLLRALTEGTPRWRRAVVMVQREVARRLLASPGGEDWGVLTVFTQAVSAVERVCEASPGCFHPPPRVYSTVVKLTPREAPLARVDETFQRVVHALFAARRKTVKNGLASVVGRERAAAVCARAEIDPGLRPEVLALDALDRLARAVATG
ncbi:MAG: ribosomal RNA small subunit methyltransferase A [Deltaproteobacteria bacterium]|nr:ribosomal RNA small subunit methyltransferase A [Deltaproteobacteria bacterium]